jgi:diguanylate cyclase (GGDEF)-like protein
MKILVVDDDPATASTVLDTAKRLGHACVVLRDGSEAWKLLSGPSDIDFVISAWRPPGLSGRELCRRVRARAGRYLPFVFVTAPGDAEAQTAGIRAGADDYLVRPPDVHALHLRLVAGERLVRLHRRLEAQADELRRLNSTLFDQGRRDVVTGIPNRLRLEEDFGALFEQAEQLGVGCSLAMIDVDHFKRFNDTFGHKHGDDVLRAIARAIDLASRGGDQVYRYGGEEFVLVLQTDDPDQSLLVVERVRRAVERLSLGHAVPGARVTVSIGVASMPGHAPIPIADVLERADAAMYRAKREGRNRVAAWDPAVDHRFASPPETGVGS